MELVVKRVEEKKGNSPYVPEFLIKCELSQNPKWTEWKKKTTQVGKKLTDEMLEGKEADQTIISRLNARIDNIIKGALDALPDVVLNKEIAKIKKDFQDAGPDEKKRNELLIKKRDLQDFAQELRDGDFFVFSNGKWRDNRGSGKGVVIPRKEVIKTVLNEDAAKFLLTLDEICEEVEKRREKKGELADDVILENVEEAREMGVTEEEEAEVLEGDELARYLIIHEGDDPDPSFSGAGDAPQRR